MTEADIHRIERETREQRETSKWFQFRRFRITASYFGEIFRRRATTQPDALVLRLLGVNTHQKDSASMAWGRSNESLALEKYKEEKLASGHEHIVVSQSGLWVSPNHSFLGASPDAAVYDRLKCLVSLRSSAHTSIETSPPRMLVLIPHSVVK